MSKRTDRRRTLICCALELDGPATLADLAHALRRPQFLIWSDLTVLEEAGVVATEWVQRPGWPDGALVAAYRLPGPVDEAQAAEDAAFDDRLRTILHEIAEALYPGEESTP